MNQSANSENNTSAPILAPVAEVRMGEQAIAKRLKTRLWWLTGFCLLLALGLVFASFRSQGTLITVRFKEGHGLKAGDTLRYRGIDCGSVTGVNLSKDRGGVDVVIRVFTGSELVAVEGSRFWIQRARLSLSQVSGLDTVLGAKYVGVLPGDSQELQTEFVGLESPLAMTEGDSLEIEVQFPTGLGLEEGHPVRYRGIKVGEVTQVALSADVQWVRVDIRLVGASRELAREGTQFWIEYPRLELTEIRGLDTLLGGSYVALEPGPPQAAPTQTFVGLAEPPPLPRRPGSLEIELDASTRLGIVRGAPVVYRGLEVGNVVHVDLSQDGASVKVTAVIDAEYGELVREDSKWWAVGGIRFNAGLSGVEISVDSVSSWVRGGIAFATPPQPGKPVVTGHRFMLEAKPLDEWLQWQPRIARGTNGKTQSGLSLPTAQRVVFSWKSTILGIGRRQTEECWGIVLNSSALAIPSRLVDSVSQVGSGVALEVGGLSIPFQAERMSQHGAIAVYRLPQEWTGESWPTQFVQSSFRPDIVLLVINSELSEPMAIDGTRLEPLTGVGVKIAPGVPISKELNGSPVVDSATGSVFGLLCHTDNGWIVGAMR